MHDGEKHRKDVRLEVRQRRHNRRFGENADMRQLHEPVKSLKLEAEETAVALIDGR